MAERLHRRELFKAAAWLSIAATTATLNTIFARRIGQEKHPLTPQALESIRPQTEIIAPRISFHNFENAKEIGASGYDVIPKPQGFARLILAMSYFEGGDPGVNQTTRIISERGLEIVLGETESGASGEAYIPHSRDEPYRTIVKPVYLLSAAQPFVHEIYHIHQHIRDGENAFLINISLGGAFTVLVYSLVGTILDQSKQISRRRFLSVVLKLGLTAGIVAKAPQSIIPRENQAYTQTDESIPDTLAADPYFRNLQENLFDFKN